MVRCACGLEAVIRTSWSNQNPGRRFYGCPTLSPTCVNFLRLFDPPMCQRSAQIIPRLLRLCNELEEIFAMVEEMKFLIISWVVFGFYVYCTMWMFREVAFLLDVLSRFVNLEQLRLLANSDMLKDQLLLLDIIDERRSFIGELGQCLPTNVVVYKTRQELKVLQKDDMIRAMEMRSTAL
ncbi:zinc finger, GRF-type containing protein [Tanacetum coccineum]